MPGAAPDLDPRLQRLTSVLRGYGPTLTAFSGGVDSTLVACVAARVHPEALAVTGVSASLATSEREQAVELARRLGLRHRTIETDELSRAAYRANAGDRCFHCKSELFERLVELAADEGLRAVASGDNLDDLGDHRPGMKAAEENGIKKPLIEAELTKLDVRELARGLGLPNHHKPAAPCLASRVPHGTPVDPEALRRIDVAEAEVRKLGFVIFRVRHHGELARLELASQDMPRALELRTQLVAAIKRAGYHFVSLDLSGFRSGSLNVVLTPEKS